MSTLKKSLMLNPFQRIAGTKALLFGITGIVLTAWLSSYTQLHFNGMAYLSMSKKTVGFHFLLSEHLINWLLPVIMFYLIGMILSSSKIRFIDMLGTFAFAKIPLFFITFLGFIPSIQYFMLTTVIDTHALQEPNFIKGSFLSLLIIPFVVWNIIWMFQAYKTSCNLKGARLGWSFAILLVLSEFICRILIMQLNKLTF
jgi:hypothetical protein